MDDDIDYTTLDPGIRATVRWLRENGFHTVDSGDGAHKGSLGWDEDEYLPVAHVCMLVRPEVMREETLRLVELLADRGIMVYPQSVDENRPEMIAQFDPASGTCTLVLSGVSDALLYKVGEN